MIVNVTIQGDRALIARLHEMPAVVRKALYAKVTALALKLENLVKTGKLNGQVLNRITGALSRSIYKVVVEDENSVFGKVASSGDVKYAAIHEYGGVINHPGGTAFITGPKGMLTFISNKAATSEMPRTAPHTITMPERSFMRSSLRDMSVEISQGMKTAVIEAIRKQVSG